MAGGTNLAAALATGFGGLLVASLAAIFDTRRTRIARSRS
jgi:hypothetical protein